jgi:hypothetical protein
LKRKKPDFMQGEPPSWTQWWHRQNGASGGAKCINTWGPTGAKGRPNRVGMGLGRWAQDSWPGPLRGSLRSPFSCTRRSFNPKFVEAPPFAKDRESFAWEAIHKLERRGGRSFARRIALFEGSTHKWRRRKTPSEASTWSTVPCLAPWWGNTTWKPQIGHATFVTGP